MHLVMALTEGTRSRKEIVDDYYEEGIQKAIYVMYKYIMNIVTM